MLDYDLVIIGGTPAGRYAALTATNFPARVALVEPPRGQDLPAGGKESIDLGLRYSQTLREAARFAQQISRQQLGVRWEVANSSKPIELQFEGVLKWAEGVVSNLSEIDSLDVLVARGVDVIFGSGEFVAKPDLAFVAGGRSLRSLCYLLACPTLPAIPNNIEGLSSAGFFTSETVGELAKLPQLPKSLAVIGADPSGVEVAQTFARLGVAVTLVVKSSHILAKEDREAAGLVQAGMEAEGVRILTATEVTQARVIEGKKWIQAGPRAIEAEEIFLAAGRGHNFSSLNLEAAKVKFSPRGVILNEKLQTTNRRIYAIGDVAGGYPFPHIANYEAAIAVKNALFWPLFQIDYRGIPWAIFSDPQLARVGLTEAQARRRFGDDLIVCREYFKNVERAQMCGETTGFCKIVGRRNGEILGASIVGPQAAELIHAIALAVRHGMKVEAIAQLPYIWSSFSTINGQTAVVWESQRLGSNTFSRNLWDNLFHWRRYWNK